MEATTKALEAWRAAARELDLAAERLLADPECEDFQKQYAQAMERERLAREGYHAQVESVRVRQGRPEQTADQRDGGAPGPEPRQPGEPRPEETPAAGAPAPRTRS